MSWFRKEKETLEDNNFFIDEVAKFIKHKYPNIELIVYTDITHVNNFLPNKEVVVKETTMQEIDMIEFTNKGYYVISGDYCSHKDKFGMCKISKREYDWLLYQFNIKLHYENVLKKIK